MNIVDNIDYNFARKTMFNIYKHKYHNTEQLTDVINEIIHEKTKYKNYKQFWKFDIHDLKIKISERLNYLNRKLV